MTTTYYQYLINKKPVKLKKMKNFESTRVKIKNFLIALKERYNTHEWKEFNAQPMCKEFSVSLILPQMLKYDGYIHYENKNGVRSIMLSDKIMTLHEATIHSKMLQYCNQSKQRKVIKQIKKKEIAKLKKMKEEKKNNSIASKSFTKFLNLIEDCKRNGINIKEWFSSQSPQQQEPTQQSIPQEKDSTQLQLTFRKKCALKECGIEIPVQRHGNSITCCDEHTILLRRQKLKKEYKKSKKQNPKKNRGGNVAIIVRYAQQIRKDGEKWIDAVKRASEHIKQNPSIVSDIPPRTKVDSVITEIKDNLLKNPEFKNSFKKPTPTKRGRPNNFNSGMSNQEVFNMIDRYHAPTKVIEEAESKVEAAETKIKSLETIMNLFLKGIINSEELESLKKGILNK
jgi:hypothetical protein